MNNRLIGPPIIELEFEKDILAPHIKIENILLRMKNERTTLCERCLQFGNPKKYFRSDRKLSRNCAEHLQKGRMYCKEPLKIEDKKIYRECKMVATIQNKVKLDKWDA